MNKARTVVAVLLVAAGCQQVSDPTSSGSSGDRIDVASVAPAGLMTTRGGTAMPAGTLTIEDEDATQFHGVFEAGGSTITVMAEIEGGANSSATIAFTNERTITENIDFRTGEVAFDGHGTALSDQDIINLARLEVALKHTKDGSQLEVGTPRGSIDGLISFVGMAPAGNAIGSHRQIFPSLVLWSEEEHKVRRPVLELAEPEDAERLEPTEGTGSQQASLSPSVGTANVARQATGATTPPEPTGPNPNTGTNAWLLYPPYTGSGEGTGGTGVTCVAEGYYYKVGWDWRKNLFSKRHKVSQYSPVMPRAYTAAQATARGGHVCHGLSGTDCNTVGNYRWTLDALRHDTCVYTTGVGLAGAILGPKCGDEFWQCIDDGIATTSSGCNGVATYTTDRIPFTSWSPHYENQVQYCGDGIIGANETNANCPLDVPAPESSTVCGDAKCGINETSDACPGDCGPPNCGDGVCTSAQNENTTTCPSDCSNIYCGDHVCQTNIENASECPLDCNFNYSASNTGYATTGYTVRSTIWLKAGSTFMADVCSPGASYTSDTYLRVTNPAGTVVASNDDMPGGSCGLGSRVQVNVVPADGYYTLWEGCYADYACSGNIHWTVDATPGELGRIGYWSGKVNTHRAIGSTTWTWDTDCTSGANVDPLTYCRKFWPTSTAAIPTVVSIKGTVWKTAGCTATYSYDGPPEVDYICAP